MSGAWRYRVGRDEDGKLHFVFVRYDTVDGEPNGATGIHNEAMNLADLRMTARSLVIACDEPIISLKTLKSDEEEEEKEG